MDWDFAIERNRAALFSVVMALFAMAGAARGGIVQTLPRHLRCAIFRSLRAGEAACRRLVVMRARFLDFQPGPKRPAPTRPIPKGTGASDRLPCFPLFDTRKNFSERRRRTRGTPRITSIGYIDPVFPEPDPALTPDDPLDATSLCKRLEALARALEDLRKQAKRMIRAEAQRRDAPPGPRRRPPLRPGWPPGYHQRRKGAVDEILYHCHCLARQALEPPRRQRTTDNLTA